MTGPRITARTRRQTRSRGFTLVELMVAVTGGLFVSIAVFVLAKQSSSFYRSEARAGDATFGSLVGFDRLRADIARAGYLASPNIAKDPSVCGSITNYPAGLKRLTSVYIAAASDKQAPDEIRLAGSYASPDQFETGAVFHDGTVDTVYLRKNSPAMARLGYLASEEKSLLDTVFVPGRVLRIVDKTGREQYGIIRGTEGGTNPRILLDPSGPALEYRLTSANRCGINDHGVGSLANVVNIIRYQLRTLSRTDKSYAPAIEAASQSVSSAGLTALVRDEIDPTSADGAPFEDAAPEIVAPLAVDLKFGISVATLGVNVGDQVKLETLVPGDTAIKNWMSNTVPGQGPQLVRSVRARLSVRSKEADRTSDIPAGTPGLADGLYRIGLGPNGTAPFARVRTLQADIALKNQLGVTWK